VVDGAPSVSRPLLDALPAGWPRVHVEQPPGVVPHVFNQALAVATGIYVWFLNGGGGLRGPAALARMKEALDQDCSADFICGAAYLRRDGRPLYPMIGKTQTSASRIIERVEEMDYLPRGHVRCELIVPADLVNGLRRGAAPPLDGIGKPGHVPEPRRSADGARRMEEDRAAAPEAGLSAVVGQRTYTQFVGHELLRHLVSFQGSAAGGNPALAELSALQAAALFERLNIRPAIIG
jgi:hypothetical protein